MTGSGAAVESQRCDGGTTASRSWRTTWIGILPSVVDAPTAACCSHCASASPLGNDVSMIPVRVLLRNECSLTFHFAVPTHGCGCGGLPVGAPSFGVATVPTVASQV